MTRTLKRLLLSFAALAVVAVCALLGVNALISADAVRDAAKAELRATTGFEPVFEGPSQVSLFPSGTVSFADVRLGEAKAASAGEPAQGPALTAERLDAHLRFLPMLVGDVDIADITLVEPRIVLDYTAGGLNWSSLVATLEKGLAPGSKELPSLSEIRIQNGTVIVVDRARGISEQFDTVNLSLAWPQISKGFAATGGFNWRGEPIEASMTLSDFAAALTGNRTGARLRIAGQPLKVAFDGSVSVRPSLKIEGALSADMPSLRDVVAWMGQKPLPGAGFGRFSLKSQMNVAGGTIALTGVNLELDGNSAEGVLTFATDGRQTLQGTLAAETVDLAPYVSTVRILADSQREWNDTKLNLDGLAGLDVDLRVSAARVLVSGVKLGRTAVGTNLRNGNLTVTVGESQAFGGVIRGSFGLSNLENGVEAKSQMQFSGVDLAACLDQVFGLKRLEGTGTMSIALEGSGASVLALTHTLTGTASVRGQNGNLVGINVEQILRRLERRPLSGSGDLRSGKTAYDTFALGLTIANGKATVTDARIDGPSIRLALTGTAEIPSRELALKGTAGLVTTGATTPAFELPFIVEGSWNDPAVLPDPEILIRRSGAAAPLLDAVRDRKARGAVRSAIDRLIGTGGGAPPAMQ